MEYLFADPNILYKKICYNNSSSINYNFKSFTILNDYIPLEFYNKFLNTLPNHKFKNIWNHIVTKWVNMDQKINNKEYLKSKYSKQKYNYNHKNIDIVELDSLLDNFIDNDILMALFAVNCIQNYYIQV
mgnify:CR=1 FL=1|tara:strand:- start:1420 stop:1806 length:387 start_codon:yes stop_codon:yes gene_type:complete